LFVTIGGGKGKQGAINNRSQHHNGGEGKGAYEKPQNGQKKVTKNDQGGVSIGDDKISKTDNSAQ